MAKKKKTNKALVYFIAAIMLLSAFFMGTRLNEPTQRSQPEGSIIGYNVTLMGDSAAIVKILSAGGDIIAIPTSTRDLTSDSLSYILDNNITGVANTTFEYSNSYAFFRFETSDFFKNDSEVTHMLDGYIREYTIYRSYDGDASGVTVELIGTPDLSEGDNVTALMFKRSDNLKITAIQKSKVGSGNLAAGNESAE